MKLSHTAQAILLMLASMIGFASMSIVIRMVGQTMHSTQVVLLRNIISLLLIIAWSIWLYKGRPNFRTVRLTNHFWRSTFGIAAMQLWFYSLTIMPVTLATALSYTTPVFTTIIAIVFLGEKAGWRRWTAIIISFIGVWVILRPDSAALEGSAGIVLVASMLMAIAGILVKTLTRTEAPETIIFYMSVFMLGWSIIPALFHWGPISLYQLWLVFLIALLSTAAHLCMTRAFVRSDMVTLMPFDFIRMLVVALLAYIFFDEKATAYTWIGSLLILLSTVYIAHRETADRRVTPSPGL